MMPLFLFALLWQAPPSNLTVRVSAGGGESLDFSVGGFWFARTVNDPARSYCPKNLHIGMRSKGLDTEGYGWAWVVCDYSRAELPTGDIVVAFPVHDPNNWSEWVYQGTPGWGPYDLNRSEPSMMRLFHPVNPAAVTIRAAGAHLDQWGNPLVSVGPFWQETKPWWGN